MNVQQIARANTTWMESPPIGKVAHIVAITSLLCVLIMISLVCALASAALVFKR